MKGKLLSCLIAITIMAGAKDRNILSSRWNKQNLKGTIVSKADFKPFAPKSDRQFWDNVSTDLREETIQKAEKSLTEPWKALLATKYMEFRTIGDRQNFQDDYFGRRNKLYHLAMAEVLENKGKYLPEIINGIWLLSEESSWCLPAHMGSATGLPELGKHEVDLFAAETSMLLALTYYYHKAELDKINPSVSQRIEYEIKERILKPSLERSNFGWQGSYGTQRINNWTPWIVSNWVISELLIEENDSLRLKSIAKSLKVMDLFINNYGDDGGCDEGSMYWGHAAGSMLETFIYWETATNGKINIYNEPIIKNMATFIYKMYIDGNYYVNFADATSVINMHQDGPMLYQFGKKVNDPPMMAFGSDQMNNKNESASSGKEFYSWTRMLMYVQYGEESKKYRSAHPGITFPKSSALTDVQVFVSRDKNLFLAAQGGHNEESHNHNDVGNFICYAYGKPFLIDAGVDTYTAKTFSAKRYEIWTMQSAYHNLPLINGNQEKDGREFKATDVKYKDSPSAFTLSMELKNAYPANTGIQTWKRSWLHQREKSITLTDDYTLTNVQNENFWTFMSLSKPEISGNALVWSFDGKKASLTFPKGFIPTIEDVDFPDGRLSASWKTNKIYRILLKPAKMKSKDKVQFQITTN